MLKPSPMIACSRMWCSSFGESAKTNAFCRRRDATKCRSLLLPHVRNLTDAP